MSIASRIGAALSLSMVAACGGGDDISRAQPIGGDGSGPGGVVIGGGSTDPETSGAGGSDGSAPEAPACAGNVAFTAATTAFTFPTAEPLAAALDELVYPPDGRPLSFAMMMKAGAYVAAVSATEQNQAGIEAFPASSMPSQSAVVAEAGGFSGAWPQAKGYLRLVDAQGVVYVELADLRWTAVTSAPCESVWIAVDAVIPASQGAIVLHLADGQATIGDLAGAAENPSLEGYQVRVWFDAPSSAFDFASMGSP